MKLKSSMIALAALSVVTFTAYADTGANMAPPPPAQNKVFDGMVGTWTGTSDMMGTQMNDVLHIHWALNHQFLIMDLVAKNVKQPKSQYEGMGVFGLDMQGNAKTWWFDSWGANAMSTGTGTFNGNTLTMNDSNAMFKETRSFEVKGNEMVMEAKGTMTWQGKETAFDNTTTYHKK